MWLCYICIGVDTFWENIKDLNEWVNFCICLVQSPSATGHSVTVWSLQSTVLWHLTLLFGAWFWKGRERYWGDDNKKWFFGLELGNNCHWDADDWSHLFACLGGTFSVATVGIVSEFWRDRSSLLRQAYSGSSSGRRRRRRRCVPDFWKDGWDVSHPTSGPWTWATDGPACVAIGGEGAGSECRFPFTYEGVVYKGCAYKPGYVIPPFERRSWYLNTLSRGSTAPVPPGSLGWCSTKRDINGIHVNGPAGNPWVCTNSICHRLFAIIFKTTTFEITKNLIFVQVFIAFHEFMNSDLAHLFLFSKFSMIFIHLHTAPHYLISPTEICWILRQLLPQRLSSDLVDLKLYWNLSDWKYRIIKCSSLKLKWITFQTLRS